MDKKRREFLKVAGISTVAGLGAPAVVNHLVSGGSPLDAMAARKIDPDAHGAVNEHKVANDEHGSGHEEVKTGKRFGMVIDLPKFQKNPGLGEKCVKACHTVHNVPSFPDKKDEIKWIWLTEYENGFTEHSQLYRNDSLKNNQVLVLCNHCDNPPCVRACPTKATYKSKDGGIIMMDFHRCIGCRFCMAACPYGSRSFNWRDPRPFIDEKTMNREYPTRMRGVVEKCNFCAKRIADGKQPACVEAAGSTNAIIFGDLNDPDSAIRKVLKENYTIQRKPSLGTHPSVFYIV